MKRSTSFIVAVVLVIVGVAVIVLMLGRREFVSERVTDVPVVPAVVESVEDEEIQEQAFEEEPLVSDVLTDLEIPWSLVFLPEGRMMFTERAGRVRITNLEGELVENIVYEPEDAKHIGEGGVLGLTLHPQFKDNNFVYLYYTSSSGWNKLVRGTFSDNSIKNVEVLLENSIPSASNHNGGRIAFGPDEKLYVTTGDAEKPELSRRQEWNHGKILRLNDDGSVPSDNPFGNLPVFSLGHRNPQGLAWDDDGQLWSTEHGSSATDELNRIDPGLDYGWPTIRGDESAEGLESPYLHSGTDVTWAPSGAAYLEDAIYFAGLRSQTLYRVDVSGSEPVLTEHLVKQFGRLRDVVVGPDGFLYVLTSNQDGRGLPSSGDDRIIRVNPTKL